ncbi:MAG: response regulator transcription factor, partial [Chloroflexia bacterium]
MDHIRVLIADDQPIFRRGVAQSLMDTEGIKDVIEMCPVTLLNRVEALSTLSVDVLIYGNMSRGLTSLIVPWVVLKQQPNMKVIVVGSAVDDDDLLNALTLGISAYVPRHSSLDELLGTVRTVANGSNPIFHEVLTRPELALHVVDLYRLMVSTEEVEETPRTASVHLSCREVEVLEYAADSYSNKQIGDM